MKNGTNNKEQINGTKPGAISPNFRRHAIMQKNATVSVDKLGHTIEQIITIAERGYLTRTKALILAAVRVWEFKRGLAPEVWR